MNEENRLLLEKYRERRKMELSENILGNGGHVVEYGGKRYQEVGYHSETLWTRTQKADRETGAADNK